MKLTCQNLLNDEKKCIRRRVIAKNNMAAERQKAVDSFADAVSTSAKWNHVATINDIHYSSAQTPELDYVHKIRAI